MSDEKESEQKEVSYKLSKTNIEKANGAIEHLESFPPEYPMNASSQWRSGYLLALSRVKELLNGND